MTNEEIYNDLKKDMQVLKVENHIQTAAVLLFFFFGIATLADIYKTKK